VERGVSEAPEDMSELDFDDEEQAFDSVKQKMNAGDRFLAAADGRWWRRGFNNFFRYMETFRFVTGLIARELAVQRAPNETEARRLRGRAARFCRRGLLQLGPTFIKAGQILSTRVDVVPQEYINELSTLQDNVPVSTTSGEYAKRVIRREFGKKVTDLFSDFEETPFACASLGQVHRATEKFTGRRLAIKVQRAGIAKLLEVDLKTLRLFARLANKFDPNADGAKRDWVTLCEQSAAVLLEECDYRLEANNAMAFARNFEGIDWVKVPEVLPELTSRRVLTMEYVPGVKINNIGKLNELSVDPKWCAARVSDAYLLQLCRHGFFHCDPHPGNIAVLPPEPVVKEGAVGAIAGGAMDANDASAANAKKVLVAGEDVDLGSISDISGSGSVSVSGESKSATDSKTKEDALVAEVVTSSTPMDDVVERGYAYSKTPRPTIVWYDFGMVRALGTDMRKNIVDLVVSIYDNDAMLATDTLYKLDAVVPGTEKSAMRRFSKNCLDEFTRTLDTGSKWMNQGSDEDMRKELRAQRAKIGADLLTFGSETPLVVPPSFALIFRALTTLDGLGKTLDNKYDLTRLARPFIKDLVIERNGGTAVYATSLVLKNLGWRPKDIRALVTSPRKISKIDDFCGRLESGEAQLQVRTLEAELALQRVEAVQAATLQAVLATSLLNVGLLLGPAKIAAATTVAGKVWAVVCKLCTFQSLCYAGAVYTAAKTIVTLFKLKKLKNKQRKLGLLSEDAF